MPSDALAKYAILSPHRIADREFSALRGVIAAVCGIHIAENRKFLLQNRLTPRLHELGLKDFSQYLEALRGPDRALELTRLFELVAPAETAFFRNPPQLALFQDILLPEAIADARRNASNKLRLFSAGCASGEEPYALAMILAEALGEEISDWDLRITAADLSASALGRAMEGLYEAGALESVPHALRVKYFLPRDGAFRIRPEIKKLVQFKRMNLNDPAQVAVLEPSHFIFCRNVIIYLGDEAKRRLLRTLRDNLLPGGSLFVGHSESLGDMREGFVPNKTPAAVAYGKKAAAA